MRGSAPAAVGAAVGGVLLGTWDDLVLDSARNSLGVSSPRVWEAGANERLHGQPGQLTSRGWMRGTSLAQHGAGQRQEQHGQQEQ